jgi:excisionase family DNA binding protein
MTSSALAHSVPEACSIACAGRTSVYEAIRSGALRAVKRGRRTLILDDDLRRWVQSLPSIAVKSPQQSSNRSKANV